VIAKREVPLVDFFFTKVGIFLAQLMKVLFIKWGKGYNFVPFSHHTLHYGCSVPW